MSIRFPGLGLFFSYVGKSVRIFGFEVSIYGILLAAGMLLGFTILVVEAKRANEDQNLYLMMAVVALITGIMGARLFYVLFSWPLYQDHAVEILYIQNGGMSVYGAILGGALGIALFAALEKLPFWQMADIACIGFLSGQIIARWGDFFNRESFGEYDTTALAMQLPLSAVRPGEVTALMREHLETIGTVSCIRVRPLFLYESVWCLLLLFYLLAWKRKKKFQGEICMRYLAGYGLGRFFIEWSRTDSLLVPGTRVPVGMVICVALFAIFGLAAHVSRSMVKKREVLRRRRREAVYEAEERAEAEMDAAEKKEEELARQRAAQREAVPEAPPEEPLKDEEPEAPSKELPGEKESEALSSEELSIEEELKALSEQLLKEEESEASSGESPKEEESEAPPEELLKEEEPEAPSGESLKEEESEALPEEPLMEEASEAPSKETPGEEASEEAAKEPKAEEAEIQYEEDRTAGISGREPVPGASPEDPALQDPYSAQETGETAGQPVGSGREPGTEQAPGWSDEQASIKRK